MAQEEVKVHILGLTNGVRKERGRLSTTCTGDALFKVGEFWHDVMEERGGRGESIKGVDLLFNKRTEHRST